MSAFGTFLMIILSKDPPSTWPCEETQAWIKKAQAWVIGPLQPVVLFKASIGKEETEREEVPVNREGSTL